MFKLNLKQRRQSKEYLRQKTPDDLANLLKLVASWLEPLRVNEAGSDMDFETQVYLQKILHYLAKAPEFFEQATMLLGLIYLDNDEDDSPEVAFKNLFASDSTIPLMMKKTVLEELITKNQENANSLAFYIIETILPKEDEAQRDYLLTLVLGAMKNSTCENTTLRARRLLFVTFENKLYTPNNMSKILKDIMVQLAHSKELLLFFSDIGNIYSAAQFLVERHSENATLQWTTLALHIFQDVLPTLSVSDVHVFLNKLSDSLLEHNLSMEEQQQLLEPLLTMNLSESVIAWANFILENLSPPPSPVKSYRSISPIAPFWDRTKWEVRRTQVYRTVGLTDILEFKEVVNSLYTFCPFQALGISKNAITQKIEKIELLMKNKFDDYKSVKREIDNLNAKYAGVNSSWHPKDLMKYEKISKLERSLYDECVAFDNEINTYKLFLSTFAQRGSVNDIPVLVNYAKLANVKVCLWKRQEINEVILLEKSHDDFLDSDTLHFVMTNTYLNQLHRADIKHHMNVVLSGVSFRK